MDIKGMDIYKKYAMVKSELETLSKMEVELRKTILDEIKDEEEPARFVFGTFTKKTTVTWKYSEVISNVKKEITKLQKKEQEDGTAQKEEKLSMVFIPPDTKDKQYD